MITTLVSRTTLTDLRPLGRSPLDLHGLLMPIIRARLTDAHANLFAEPVGDASDRSVDWHTDDRVQVYRLRDVVDPEIRASIEATLQRQTGDVLALSESLSRGRPEEKAIAIELRNAIQIPSPDFVFVREVKTPDGIERSPLLVAWGYRTASDPGYGEAPRALGTRLPPVTEPPPAAVARALSPATEAPTTVAATLPPPPPSIPRQPFRLPFPLWWLLFPLLLALLIAIGWSLGHSCGIGLPGGSRPLQYFCPSLRAADIATEIPSLRDAVADLEARAATRRETCRQEAARPAPPVVAPTPPTPPNQDAEGEIQQRLKEANAGAGDLQISLSWENNVDLDLFVKCPDGRLIGFPNRSACGGQLDVDRNARAADLTSTPVENIVWSDERAIGSGPYEVYVLYCAGRGNQDPTVPFKLRIRSRGDTRIESGVASRRRDASSGLCPNGCESCLVKVTTIQR